jgi:hypothetical protein
MIKIKNVKMIDVSEWDKLVKQTYKRPYSFQQQNGCQGRGTFNLTIPSKWAEIEDSEMHDSIPEKVNGNEMGVQFKVWLDRDPKQSVEGRTDYSIGLFWERNFYPSIEVVANDLHEKGLIEAGEYVIDIDW